MSRQLASEIATLYNNGWRPFTGTVATSVYDFLPCGKNSQENIQLSFSEPLPPVPRPKKRCSHPWWMFCGDAYLCLGCIHRCALTRPQGFQLALELRYNTKREKYTLSPQEMVRKLTQLTVEQTAYCLNISRNQVYHWIREGKLPRSKTKMVRIPVNAVRELLQERDE